MFALDNIRAFLLILFVTVACAENKEAEKPLIDDLALEYLSTEQTLWAQINGDENPNTLYANVVEAHKNFIVSDFGVSTNSLAIYQPSGILVDNLRNVNDLFYETSNMLITAEQIESIDIYHVHTILRNAVAYSDHVFREANRAEFWENGKDVSANCRKQNTPMIMKLDFVDYRFSSTQNIAVKPRNHQQR